METVLLIDITIIFGLSIAILTLCHRLHIPTIVGFLVTGMLVGPHGLAVIKAIQEVEVLAEIGIVLLLFTIGIELSLKELWNIKRALLFGGTLQILFTLLAIILVASKLGRSTNESIFIGFLIALSSTAIVLKILQEKVEVDTPHGLTALSILIFQDIIIVPMILVTPLLAGEATGFDSSLLTLLVKGMGIILIVIISARWAVPSLLYQIARTRNSELFLLSIVFICFSVALLTFSIGLSLALGAFLAGLIISESEYSHVALSNILPFRDIFMSFFFVSIGMLLDIDFVLQRPEMFILIALGVLSLKALIAGFVTFLLGFPLRTTILVGLALAQVGEFSFILSKFGLEFGLLDQGIYQTFLAVSILTMAATSFVMEMAPGVADRAMKLPLPEKIKRGIYPLAIPPSPYKKEHLKDHIIIIGYGFNGRTVAKAARVANIPYIIIEMNAETVKKEREKGEYIYYGDATQRYVLEHADIKNARVLVIGISDPMATRRITAIVHRINPKLHIIARTRYLQEMGPLHELGADEVIPEEFETSVEIFVRLLKKYLVPRDVIEKLTSEVRADGYEIFRSISGKKRDLIDLSIDLPDVEISAFRVEEGAAMAGMNLAQIDLRKKYGITLLAIRRGGEIISNPKADTQVLANDSLVVMGKPERIAEVSEQFVKKNKENNLKGQNP